MVRDWVVSGRAGLFKDLLTPAGLAEVRSYADGIGPWKVYLVAGACKKIVAGACQDVTGDGLAAGLLLCGALKGRRLSEVAAVMPLYPQVKENVRVAEKDLTPAIVKAVKKLNREWAGSGRILVRPSGTEPLIRVLAEAENDAVAHDACASIASLVRRELG